MNKRSFLTNEYRKLSALALALIMSVSVIIIPSIAKAEDVVEVKTEVAEAESDLMEVQAVEVSSFAVMKGHFLHKISEQADSDNAVTVSVDDRNWQLYRTTYVFDQMNSEEKALYNELEDVCMDYAKNSDKDAIYLKDTSGNGAYYLPAVSVKGFAYDEFVNVLQMFIYSNPQYYFTTSSFAVSGDNLYLYCYPAFADGEDRAQVTNSLFATVDTWLKNVTDDNDTTIEIEKAAHDLLCNNISYDYDAVDQMNSGDYSGDAFYTQSIYSAIKNHKSVCAGYSLTFELLMNAAGIPTVAAYSDYHAWNKVYLGDGCWYAVDVTWDDCDDGSRINYSFYNKSDATIQKSDDGLPVHVAKMAEYYPAASKDYDESEYVEATVIDYSEEIDDIYIPFGETVDESEDVSDDVSVVEPVDDENSIEVVNVNDDIDQDNNSDVTINTDISNDISEEDSIEDTRETGKETISIVDDVDESDKNVIYPTDNTGSNQNTSIVDTKPAAEETMVTTPVNSVESNITTTVIAGRTGYAKTSMNDEEETAINVPKISKVKSGSKKCKITWKKVKDISGYEIQLSTSKKFKKIAKTVKVSEASSSVTVKKLKKKTTYFVRMRTYIIINGKRITSDWSGVKKVTVK